MTKAKPAVREALLDAAQRLLLVQGFEATSVDEICAGAGVTKGAFFHYFKNKDKLAKATFERFCRRGAERYQGAAFVKTKDPLERLNGYIDFTISQIQHPTRDSCLVGVFAQELAPYRPDLRTMCAGMFEQWALDLKTMLDAVKQQYAPRRQVDTRSLAQHFIAVFEGSLILAKAENSVAPVRRHMRHFQEYVNALFLGSVEQARRRWKDSNPAF